MPANRGSYGQGGNIASASVANYRQDFALSSDATVTSLELLAGYMPGQFLWILQTDALPSPATWVFQGTIRPVLLGGGDEWLTLRTGVTTPGTPVILPLTFPVTKTRVRLTRVAGVQTTVQLLVASAAVSSGS